MTAKEFLMKHPNAYGRMWTVDGKVNTDDIETVLKRVEPMLHDGRGDYTLTDNQGTVIALAQVFIK